MPVQRTTLVGLFMLLVSTSSYADKLAQISIKTAQLSQQQGTYLLNARVHYQLSEEAIEALHNGVTLTFNVELSIIEPRPWLWNKYHSRISLPYQIKYHTLAKIYQTTNHHSSSQHNFASLEAALYAMGQLNDVPINTLSNKTSFHKNGALRAYLNIEALPLPMRPLAYLTPGWHLQSDRYLWPLKQ